MGRQERPLDPGAGPEQRFAFALRKLRSEAGGPTYRAMAQRTPYTVSTLSRAAAGEQLPSLEVTLAYVAACGGDRLVDDLVGLVRTHRFVVLVGASGRGKSSLLRAGLIPRLRGAEEPYESVGEPYERPAAVRILAPGEHPARTHAEALAPMGGEGGESGEGETVVVVDQFEEVFTLCCDPDERKAFLDRLLDARRAGSGLRAVVAVRADFFGHCAEHRELAEACRDATLLIGPMAPDELRDVIVKPATAAGLVVERSLTARLIAEVAGEPGGLPLLSHVLLEAWRRRRGRTLAEATYDAVGGVRGAVARTAEDVYARLTPAQASLARRVLLRLITPGEGAQDTRRGVDRAELDWGDPADTTAVLDRLARARLITLDENTVDLAHEALITAWPRLRGWVAEDRERLRTHRQLTEAARAWEELRRETGALYRGTRLAVAREWAARDGALDELNAVERAFLEASIGLEDGERAAAARRARRLAFLAACLAVLLVVVTAVGVVAVRQRHSAVEAQRVTVSRQLAAQALDLVDSRPGTAMLLAVEAYRTAPTPEARGALLSMSARRSYQAELTGHADAVSEVAFSPDGTLASVGRDGKTVLWDARHHTRLATLTGHATWLRAVDFSPDGRRMATGGDDRKVVLWDVAHRTKVATLTGHRGPVKSVAFSPDGRTVAGSSDDGTVRLWNTDPRRTATQLCTALSRDLTREEWRQLIPEKSYRRTCDMG
ncbi:nSTAND1 domain-containing NTPase [Streptomyces milbemycinicus]|uniref:nSTAND1 domain-containing NTPase n=1 Tax=Streptomyces milbemycinicus TaxID=476552 RepID=UPI0033D8D35B